MNSSVAQRRFLMRQNIKFKLFRLLLERDAFDCVNEARAQGKTSCQFNMAINSNGQEMEWQLIRALGGCSRQVTIDVTTYAMTLPHSRMEIMSATDVLEFRTCMSRN